MALGKAIVLFNIAQRQHALFHCVYFRFKAPEISQRCIVFSKYITNKDKKKHWDPSAMTSPSPSGKCRNVFENIHKPRRRINVLNSLFIESITDIISTGDIAPEIMNFGIEITQVNISPDYQILNIFWQLPKSEEDFCADIQKMLSKKAPQIRSELISRNIIGKVPKMFFVQNRANAYASEFEKALAAVNLGAESDEVLVPEQDFMKDLMIFKSAREKRNEERLKEKGKCPEILTKKETDMPKNPVDMKVNLLGLNHDALMKRVIMAKKKKQEPIIETESTGLPDKDLFGRISGHTLHGNMDRSKLIKQFNIDRKIQMREMLKTEMMEDENELMHTETSEYEDFRYDDQDYEADYIDEDENKV